MRIVFLWTLLAIGVGVFVAMLLATWHHDAHAPTPHRPRATVELLWSLVPWLLIALCVGPAVNRVLASG